MNSKIQVVTAMVAMALCVCGCDKTNKNAAGNGNVCPVGSGKGTASAVCPAMAGKASGGGVCPAMSQVKRSMTVETETSGAQNVQVAIQQFVGSVLETIQASNYTYVLVASASDTNQIWVATPQLDVKKGDKVAVPLDMPMRNFKSPTLNRTFDLLYMAPQIKVMDK